jgi:hypothetical protein
MHSQSTQGASRSLWRRWTRRIGGSRASWPQTARHRRRVRRPVSQSGARAGEIRSTAFCSA